MKNIKNFGLYLVETDIIEADFNETVEEVVVRSEYISHITGLPTNKYKCVRVEEKI